MLQRKAVIGSIGFIFGTEIGEYKKEHPINTSYF